MSLAGIVPRRSVVILAGGGSSRMGEEKAFLEFDGKPLICWTVEKLKRAADEIIIVAKDEAHSERLRKLLSEGQDLGPKIIFTWDSIRGFGPVAGLDAGLGRANGIFAFATGCDLPFLKPEVIARLFELAEKTGYEAAVPVQDNGFYEPLHSVYHREKMLFACRRALEKGERRIHVPLQELRVNRVQMECFRLLDPELLTFFNLNTQEDLEAARALWPKHGHTEG
jgi:molybdopterin-guanine dinucleotide biosynthesis protein A